MKIFIDNPKYCELINPGDGKIVDLNLVTKCDLGVFFHPTLETLSQKLLNPQVLSGSGSGSGIKVSFVLNKRLHEEEYHLIIKSKAITIKAASERGAYYGLLTLLELKEQKGKVSERIIKDEPALKIRGFHLDIARGKVPKLETFYEIIDLLSTYRYNFLELYIEGFAFEYKSFPFVYQNHNYLTVEEYLAVQHYANQKFIDLVASENGFGHMSEWLKIEQYKHLAICDELFEIWGSKKYPSTLDPTNERSVELVKTLYQDLIPLSNSKYFNMNFDEPYELGYGKTKEICERIGKEKVFVNYFNTLAEVVKKYEKTPLLWGDFIIHNPNAIKALDKDAILIDWGYSEDYPFMLHARMLKRQKRKFLTAPGTASWSSAASKLTEMLGSVNNAAWAAYENQGLGMIMTDWGDFGHIQYFPFTYPGIIYASSMMWNPEKTTLHGLKHELQTLVNNNTLAEIIMELSLYSMQEDNYRGYSTKLFSPIIYAETSEVEQNPTEVFKQKVANNILNNKEIQHYDLYLHYLKDKLALVKDDSLLKKQLSNTINLLLTLLKVHRFLANPRNNILAEINEDFDNYLHLHKRLWCMKNKEDGYEISASRIIVLKNRLAKLTK